MKNFKFKILTFALVLCLTVPCAMLLSGCKHEHTLTKVDYVGQTCTTTGNTEYYKCDCGKYFSDDKATTEIVKNSWVIDKDDHNLAKTSAIETTCTTDGNSEYWTCLNCHKYFGDEDGEFEIYENSWVVYATGHLHDIITYQVDSDKVYEVKSCACEDSTRTEMQDVTILTPATAYNALNAAETGTFILSDGQYDNIGFFDASKSRENITILGTPNARVQKFYIGTAVKLNNFTFKNVTFNGTSSGSSGIAVKAQVSNLVVNNCKFINASSIVCDQTYSVTNFTLTNSHFDQTGANGTYSPIYFSNKTYGTVVVSNNVFKNCVYNAIQFNGTVDADILIDTNIIDGTVDRAIRLGNVSKTVTIRNNVIKNVQEASKEGVKVSSTTETGSVVFEANMYETLAWDLQNVPASSGSVIYFIPTQE